MLSGAVTLAGPQFIATGETYVPALLAEARQLQAAGEQSKALELYLKVVRLAEAAQAKDELCEARNAAASLYVRAGRYGEAAGQAKVAAVECPTTGKGVRQAWNTLGQAQLYTGDYASAAASFTRVKDMARDTGDAAAEAYAWNNLGGSQYYRGDYYGAFRSFQSASRLVEQNHAAAWVSGPRRITLANQAMLDQRLGRDLPALKIYQQLRSSGSALRPEEEAQLLSNLGALYRRLGDPPKALEMYRLGKRLLSRDGHTDTLLSLSKNTGIVELLELADYGAARKSFLQTEELASRTNSRREQMQAHLYLGETARRAGRLAEAGIEFRQAEDLSRKLGTGEERWKALHGLALVELGGGRETAALDLLREAASLIEASRGSLKESSLRSDFMADKRRVYDDAIALIVRDGVRTGEEAEELLRWMELSRSRLVQDRRQISPATLGALQRRLDTESLLLLYWRGEREGALFRIGRDAWGVERLGSEQLNDSQFDLRLRDLADSTQDTSGWRLRMASALLPGIRQIAPERRRKWLVVADGNIGSIPLETLLFPGGRLVLEDASITYLPSASFLLAEKPIHGRRMPWQRQLLAMANPLLKTGSAGGSELLSGDEQWTSLPGAEQEVRSIATTLPGKSDLASGEQAVRTYFLEQAPGYPLIHLATHAVSDNEDGGRSRLLFAGDQAAEWSYLFRNDITSLKLANAELVTLSACDTGHGRLLRGDGQQTLGTAFLEAGAHATVSTLWRVEDTAAAWLMRFFYQELSAGRTKSDALREAKLRFLRVNSSARHPAYWAAFVLTGDGWNPLTPVIPWYVVASAPGLLLLAVAWFARRL